MDDSLHRSKKLWSNYLSTTHSLLISVRRRGPYKVHGLIMTLAKLYNEIRCTWKWVITLNPAFELSSAAGLHLAYEPTFYVFIAGQYEQCTAM